MAEKPIQPLMLLMKDCRLSSLQRHAKSVDAHPADLEELSRQLEAHDGNCDTRSGSVEF